MINRSIFTLIFLFSFHLHAMDKKINEKEKEKWVETEQSSAKKKSSIIKREQSSVATKHSSSVVTEPMTPENPLNFYGPSQIGGSTTVTEQHQHTHTHSHTYNYPTAISNAAAKAENTIFISMASIMENMQKTIVPLSEKLQGGMSAHKWKIAAGTGVTMYALIFAALLHGNQYLKNNETAWGHWKNHLSVDELYCSNDQTKQELTRNLFDTILNRYFKTRQPTNHIEPLIVFSGTLEGEMTIMDRYIRIATILQKSPFIRLFPTNDAKIAHAKEYRRRLQYIKQLFVNKMAEYNLDQFLAPKPPMPLPLAPALVASLAPALPAVPAVTPAVAPAA